MKIMCSLLLCCCVGLSFAQDPDRHSPTPQLDMRNLVVRAQKNNLEILSAQKAFQAVQSKAKQSWALDDPQLNIERMYAPRSQNVWTDAVEKSIAISQTMPFPSVLALRSSKSRLEVEQARLRWLKKIAEVSTQVKKTFVMLCLSDHHARSLHNQVDIMKSMARLAESRYSAGQSSQADVLKIHIELAKMAAMEKTMLSDKQSAELMLKTLVNDSLGETQVLQGDLPLPNPANEHQKNFDEELIKQPLLLEFQANRDIQKKNKNLAASMWLPEFMLQYRMRSMDMSEKTHDAMLGLSLPLWFWKQTSMTQEARAEWEMAAIEYDNMKNMTKTRVLTIQKKMKVTQELEELFRTHTMPQAQQMWSVTQTQYESGKAEVMDVLDAQRTLLSLMLDYHAILADYANLLADLEQELGVDLQEVQNEIN